jgi:hypothetical protein
MDAPPAVTAVQISFAALPMVPSRGDAFAGGEPNLRAVDTIEPTGHSALAHVDFFEARRRQDNRALTSTEE